MKLLAFVLFLGVVSNSLGEPESAAVRQRRDSHVLGNIQQYSQNIIETLLKPVQYVEEVVSFYASEVTKESELVIQKINGDIEKLTEGILNAVDTSIDKLNSVEPAVKACIQKQYKEVKHVYSQVHKHSTNCVDEDIAHIQSMVDNLSSLSDATVNYTKELIKEMRACNGNRSGLIHSGVCLGQLLLKSEYKSVTYSSQSAVMVAKINLSMLTLPAAVEVCAGRSLTSATLKAKDIISEIGSCSYSTIMAPPPAPKAVKN